MTIVKKPANYSWTTVFINGQYVSFQSEAEMMAAIAPYLLEPNSVVVYQDHSIGLYVNESVAPLPPPPTEPTGVLFSDSFESGLLTTNPSGYGWNGTSSGPSASGDKQPAISSDIAHTGTRSCKFVFGGGTAGDDAWSEIRFTLGQNMTEVYMRWYQYFPNGTEGLGPKWHHRQDYPDNNKFVKLWADNYTNYTITTGVSTRSKANGDSSIYTDWGTNQTGGVGQFGAAVDNQGIDDSRRGRWVKFQYHAKIASAANNDGVIELWIDDQLVISNKTLAMYPANGAGNYFRNGYLMGWMNSGFNQTSVCYIDDFAISDKPI